MQIGSASEGVEQRLIVSLYSPAAPRSRMRGQTSQQRQTSTCRCRSNHQTTAKRKRSCLPRTTPPDIPRFPRCSCFVAIVTLQDSPTPEQKTAQTECLSQTRFSAQEKPTASRVSIVDGSEYPCRVHSATANDSITQAPLSDRAQTRILQSDPAFLS